MRSKQTERRASNVERPTANRLVRSSTFILSLVVLLTGCHTPRTGKPVAKELSGSDPDAQISFWHELADEPVASNDQALRAILLYVDNKDDSATYEARVQALKSRSILPPGFYQPAVAGVTRGTLAVAIMNLLHEKGGVTTRIFGPSPRYAVRELMFINVLPPSTPNQAVSGNELVGIIGRVEDYQRGNAAQVPAAVMPGEMDQNLPAASKAVRE
jgi:hypothetical protein